MGQTQQLREDIYDSNSQTNKRNWIFQKIIIKWNWITLALYYASFFN